MTIVCAENLDIFPESLTSFFGTVGIAERDAAYSERYGVKIVRVPAKGYYSGRTFYSANVYRQIESLNPDLLFVHGNDSASGPALLTQGRRPAIPGGNGQPHAHGGHAQQVRVGVPQQSTAGSTPP